MKTIKKLSSIALALGLALSGIAFFGDNSANAAGTGGFEIIYTVEDPNYDAGETAFMHQFRIYDSSDVEVSDEFTCETIDYDIAPITNTRSTVGSSNCYSGDAHGKAAPGGTRIASIPVGYKVTITTFNLDSKYKVEGQSDFTFTVQEDILELFEYKYILADATSSDTSETTSTEEPAKSFVNPNTSDGILAPLAIFGASTIALGATAFALKKQN